MWKGELTMSMFENITKKVTETAKAAAKKSGDIVEVTKLNVAISTEEDKIEKEYVNIGKIVYESFCKGTNLEAAITECCERISDFRKNVEGMKQKILELKNVKTCPGCKTELEIDTAFCPKCGTKQEIPQPVVEESKENICPSCGMSNDFEAAFCSKCGSKLEK